LRLFWDGDAAWCAWPEGKGHPLVGWFGCYKVVLKAEDVVEHAAKVVARWLEASTGISSASVAKGLLRE
jgi:hypothetical protein